MPKFKWIISNRYKTLSVMQTILAVHLANMKIEPRRKDTLMSAEAILSADDVRAIADLARLELSEDDVIRYQKQLSDILGYFQKLEELDTSHIDPSSSVLPLTNVMRPDKATSALSVEDAVSNAPDSDGEQFRVSAVLDN